MAKANSNPEENEKSDLTPAAGEGFPGPEVAGDADTGIFVPEGLLDAGASSEVQQGQTHGQFDGEELEFETWMFDAGDGRGVVVPKEAGHTTGPDVTAPPEPLPAYAGAPVAHTEQAPDAEPVQVSGQAVPTPAFGDPAVSPATSGGSPIDYIHGSAQSLPAGLDTMASAQHVGAPTLPRLSPREYPDTPSGWNDQMLASVDDFSSVLLAMRGAPSPAPAVEEHEQVPTSPRKSKSHAHKAPAETPQAHVEEGAQAAPAAMQAGDSAQEPESMQAEGPFPAGAPQDSAALAAQSEPVSPGWSVPDEGLPPWLLEAGDEASHAADTEVQAEQGAGAASASSEPIQELPGRAAVEGQLAGGESGPVQIEEPPAAVSDMEAAREGALAWGGPEETVGGAQGASLEPQAGEAAPVFEPSMEMPEVPALEAVEPLEAFTPEGTLTAAASEGEGPTGQGAHGFNADEMEFESFMFDQGKVAPLPSLPNIGEFMPPVRAMESALEPHFHGTSDMPGFGFASPVQDPMAPVDIEAQIQAQSRQQAEDLAARVEMDSAVPAEEDLPFWLEDRPQAAVSGALPSLTAEDLPALPLTSFFEEVTGAPLEETGEPEAAQAEEFDFSELPPIEPFDFSLIQTPEEEEELGFRTEDLAPNNQGGREPLVVTANLDVLADLLGKDLPAVSPGATAGSPDAGVAINSILNQLAVPEAPVVSAPADLQSTGRTPGWTATETSKLSGDTVSHLTDKIGPAQASEAPQADTDELAMSDLNVMPFNLTDLDLEDEETSTEFLETTSLNKQQTTTAFPQPGKILTGTLFGQATPQEPEYWEAPDWMADVMDTGLIGTQTGDELDTSRFAGFQQVEEDEGSLPTQHLVGGRSTQGSPQDTPAYQGGSYEEFQGPIFRARVSRFRQPAATAFETVEDQDGPQLTRPIGVAPFDYEPDEQYAPPASVEEPPASPEPQRMGEKVSTATLTPVPSHAEPPTQSQEQPAGGFTSGPLPPLEGFHHLQEIVASRPTDIGARMALAVAYTQAGHVDHALYEFRRILQNRNVPIPMLGFIEDQINELEIDPASAARFHQLRGDLYMKQGRYQEAIEEYNLIK